MLSPRQRAVIVLRYYEDLPEGDAAALLNCSVGTVKTLASRAMSRLRQRLGSDVVVGEMASSNRGDATDDGI
jgi:DNA-directed RNA polymerase specialized sigma24 family protein